MKITDIIYKYQDNSMRNKYGLCRVRSFINNDQVYVVLTDLGNINPGMSITNNCYIICNSVKKSGIIPENSIFIEHYEKDTFFSKGEFDLISFRNSEPYWIKSNLQEIKKMLNCAPDEFDNLTMKNNISLQQIEQLLYQIKPSFNLPRQSHYTIVKRRLEIMDQMLKIEDLAKLVENESSERILQDVLKKDLSIFSEVYAYPKDEYICFSEVHIGSKIVDFLVLSGRSRMDIFLIEIKGANFNLLTQNHYKRNTYKANECFTQIEAHYDYINRNYDDFRASMHRIRETAEKGVSTYNMLMGPSGYLDVDPDKDINLNYIVIMGKTVNDLEESKSRHMQENSYNLPIKIETWNSFLRKLIR